MRCRKSGNRICRRPGEHIVKWSPMKFAKGPYTKKWPICLHCYAQHVCEDNYRSVLENGEAPSTLAPCQNGHSPKTQVGVRMGDIFWLQIKWNQMKPNEIKWNQTKSSEIKWKQIHSSYPTLVGLIGILIASVITAGPGPWPTQISKACIHDNVGPTAGVEASVLMNQIENSDEFDLNYWNLT